MTERPHLRKSRNCPQVLIEGFDCHSATAPLTAAGRFTIVQAMNGLNHICGICREIIR
jgi:hypothetical protein